MEKSENLSYRDAGVDIEAGAELVERIKPDIRQTMRPGVLGGLGGFGGLFELPIDQYNAPVLVSGTDGVGTKLMLANQLDQHDSIGIDLVAMCVNDIVVCGAEPLFFLDYYATGRLNLEKSARIIRGIANGCIQAGAALIGGETAEMPGMYDTDEYDLAGFAVGIVEKSQVLDKSAVQPGDSILGLHSSGCHSNGYSLVRKVLERSGEDTTTDLNGSSLGDALIEPTRIYVKPLLTLIKQLPVHALAHITGGGITENLPRSLPTNCQAVIDKSALPSLPVFEWLQHHGNITDEEMLKTFNCGIGMAVIVADADKQAAIDTLSANGQQVQQVGVVQQTDLAQPSVIYY